jgi:hypothetical protein
LRDARSVITLKATRETGGNTVSNIVWNYPHTTIPRHLKDIVVTEYGIADLRGKSDANTIAAMIAVVDSRFQNGLLAKPKEAGKISGDYEIPAGHRNNTPDHVKQWMKPFRQNELLPEFPFGTDFTEVEQRLLPALNLLKRSASSKWSLARLVWEGLTRRPRPEHSTCQERMNLDVPRSAKEHVYAMLLRGAMSRVDRS